MRIENPRHKLTSVQLVKALAPYGGKLNRRLVRKLAKRFECSEDTVYRRWRELNEHRADRRLAMANASGFEDQRGAVNACSGPDSASRESSASRGFRKLPLAGISRRRGSAPLQPARPDATHGTASRRRGKFTRMRR